MGETRSIDARVVPAGTPVTWSSSNSQSVTVNNGSVSADNGGGAIITAKIVVDGVEYTDTCEVTAMDYVVESYWEDENVNRIDSLNVQVGESVYVKPYMRTATGYRVALYDMAFGTSDSDVATAEYNSSIYELYVHGESSGNTTLRADVAGIPFFEPFSMTLPVNVVAQPQFEYVRLFLNNNIWNYPDYWAKQDYQESTRQTYIRKSTAEALYLVYNPDGTNSSLYADLAPSTHNFAYDENYDYFLDVELDPEGNVYELSFAGSDTDVLFKPTDTQPTYDITGRFQARFPLRVIAQGAQRLFVLQIRKKSGTTPGINYGVLTTLILGRQLKS